MCELFAMSSREPAGISFCMNDFTANGSSLRGNRDGWGIAFARDRDVMLVKEPLSASDSEWVRFIAEQRIQTKAAIAHIRYATRGGRVMENTHPFRRVLGRRVHLFAHNGTVDGFERAVDRSTLQFEPVGETDSEFVFCTLLSRLQRPYQESDAPPLEQRFDIFSGVCRDMRKFGTSNVLYFDGDVLFAHAHERMWEEEGRLVGPRPPGLHIKRCWRCKCCGEVNCPGLKVKLPNPKNVLLASVALDSEGWEALPEGTVIALKDGEVLMQAAASVGGGETS